MNYVIQDVKYPWGKGAAKSIKKSGLMRATFSKENAAPQESVCGNFNWRILYLIKKNTRSSKYLS